MGKRHKEIARTYRRDSSSGEYLYHLKAKWIVCGETIAVDEWIPVPEEFYTEFRRWEWKMDKHEERELKDAKGEPISLDQIMENGYTMEDDFSVEEYIEEKELRAALYTAMEDLSEKDRNIIMLHDQDLPERTIAEKVNWSQSNVNYHWNKVIPRFLKGKLEDFR